MIQSLGYVAFGATDLNEWSDFATRILGMQPIERGAASRAFRMDDRAQRLVIDRAQPEGARTFGWEVADATALDDLAARLDLAGVAASHEPAALADQRGVRDLIAFADPAGNRLEAFWGAAVDVAPFRPGRSISGFRTGPLGMGHAVLTVPRIDDMLVFYCDVLGFKVTDYILTPFRAFFLHVNPRHHSLALIEAGTHGMHHLMVELYSFDDVGQGYDIALGEPERIATTLGRHPNDLVTSFYLRSPSGFMVEYGWGGRDVDDATWRAGEVTVGPSLWGHDRAWLPAEQRDAARRMRLAAAAEGHRAPVQVVDGNYQRLSGVCPWWDAATGANAS
ncbi:MAG: VOC family protein [Acetobacteraceae bacterium]